MLLAIIKSKRREAWREGIEDVELWRHLRVAAERTGDARQRGLLKRITRAQNRTPTELMRTRLEVLRALGESKP